MSGRAWAALLRVFKTQLRRDGWYVPRGAYRPFVRGPASTDSRVLLFNVRGNNNTE